MDSSTCLFWLIYIGVHDKARHQFYIDYNIDNIFGISQCFTE